MVGRFPRPATWEQASVEYGQRWIYSAGFNTGADLGDPNRIEVEVPDLRGLTDAGARVAILSHQGSWAGGTAGSLAFAAEHLSRCLEQPVAYYPTNADQDALRRAEALAPGEVAVFGNTRQHEGEEAGDPELARCFSQLGQRVAIGGFSKAHRSHASNVGLLEHVPGFATHGLLDELERLDEFLDPGQRCARVGMLGGLKPEKVTKGLPLFSSLCSHVLLGGIVLNVVLHARGEAVGTSALGPDPVATLSAARAVLEGPHAERLVLPSRVWRNSGRAADLGPVDAHDSGAAIVDFEVDAAARQFFEARSGRRIQVLVAGTPSFVGGQFVRALDGWRELLRFPHVDAFLIGGDTVSDFALDVPRSTGGGSALSYLHDGSCAVVQALLRNQANSSLGF